MQHTGKVVVLPSKLGSAYSLVFAEYHINTNHLSQQGNLAEVLHCKEETYGQQLSRRYPCILDMADRLSSQLNASLKVIYCKSMFFISHAHLFV